MKPPRRVISSEEIIPRAVEEGEPPLPSLARQAAGLVATAARVAASGAKRADPEEVGRRMAICHACDHLRSDGRCGKANGCGCRVALKAAWKAAHCPIGKW